MVKVNETKSPWLSGMEGSVLPVAVAHGRVRSSLIVGTVKLLVR